MDPVKEQEAVQPVDGNDRANKGTGLLLLWHGDLCVRKAATRRGHAHLFSTSSTCL